MTSPTKSTASPRKNRRGPTVSSGSATPELVLVLPALFLILALVGQLVLYGLASHAVAAAAAEGESVEGQLGSSSATAVAAAQGELRAIGPALVLRARILPGTTVTGDVTITVSGQVPSLVPGIDLTVSSTSVGPPPGFIGRG